MLRAFNPQTKKRLGRKRTQRLAVESLEARRLLAGDVLAEVVEGDLVLRGDAASNLIELRPASDGTPGIEVIGLAGEDGEITTINGEASFTAVGVTGNVDAAMRGGNDLIYIHDLDLPGNLNARTGNGNDTVLIGGLPRGDAPLPEPLPEGLDAALAGELVAPGDPVDPVPILPLANVTVAGNLRISTAGGIDGIAMGSLEVAENLNITTGRQDDIIRLGVNQLPGPAADIAPVDVAISIVDQAPGISLPVDVFGSLRIGTGGGDDQVWLESVHVAHNLRAALGGGNDLLVYDWGAVGGRVVVDGGSGDDIVALAHVIAGSVAIRTRGGNDGVGLFAVHTNRLNVRLGGGDDQMVIADTSASRANLHGGRGVDSIDFQGINHLPRLRLLSFEIIT